MNVSNGNKVAVLVSGGLDSCVLAAHLAARARRVYPVYVRQGLIWESVEQHWVKRFLAAVSEPNIEPLREKLKELGPPSPSASREIEKILETMEEGVNRARGLIERFRDFPTGEGEGKEKVDLNRVLEQTIDMMSPKWKGRLRIERRFGDVPKIAGYPLQLAQIFTNVIANACDATPEGGAVTVATQPGATAAKVSVKDTGHGISKERVARIFDPFFTTKETGRGTGLGLSLSYGIVKEHEGEILVHSEPGKGATFVVELPGQKEEIMQESTAGRKAASPTPGATGRILVVDDEETIVELLMTLLEGVGHQVDIASNGRQALEKLRSADYDVIISDLKMPDMGGQKLYEALGEIKPHLQARMIFSTGDTVGSGTQSFFEKVGNPYLSKPFKLEEVEELVRKLMGEGGKPSPVP